MALPSSSSSNSEWVYDVFLSFRGDDTRLNFTDHLYKALIRAGIHTFRDGDELERGEVIGPDLLKSIEKSRFSIIIFSKNYASSTWCLEELKHIMKCRKTRGQIVLPVFYDVEPSDVGKQKRSYGEAFGGHEDRFKEQKEKLQRWRSALKEAADLSGYPVQNRYESTIIDNIVKDISNKLDHKKLKVPINLVGIQSRANAVKSLLYDESIDVRIVGIYGIGGIGKSTIAKEVYNSIVSAFEGGSFIENVREKFNSRGIWGRVDLQNQLLSNILKGKHEEICNGDEGLTLIEKRLRHISVLIVLDDVDKLEQINMILGDPCDWLSQGSRIIITTRIKGLLQSKEYREYQVMELDPFESLRLLSINAFDMCHPMEEYIECSKSVVHYAGGIPLALEVLGSYLKGQSVDVWESKLKKLKKFPDERIQHILEISYHSLDDTEKDIFLDIACFLIGRDKDYIISILDDCDFFPVDGINTLIKRSLVKIVYPNKLMMHDLIRDMGRQIVFKQCPKECGKRSRVWQYEEASLLLEDKTGTKAVEGLSLNLPGRGKLGTEAFRKMKALRLLQLNSVNLFGSYKHISKKLRWLCWIKFPLESIPSDLHMGNVVALDMPYSSLKLVWEEEKLLGKLKFLNLSHSHELTKTPNFEGLPNLEILILKDCPILVEVHESIGLLTKLVTLNLKDCRNLKNLPRSICALTSLETVNVSGCLKLDKFPDEFGNMKSLVVFAANRTVISIVFETFANLKNLTRLELSECQLKPSPIKGPNLSGFLSLRDLDLSYCKLPDDLIPNYLQNLPLLEYLDLSGNSFSSLPPTISLLPKLTYLLLSNCRRLQSIPKLSSSVFYLYADGCTNLVESGGCFKVEPLGVEIVKEVLEPHGLSVEESIANVRVRMISPMTNIDRISPLQGVSERGIYNLFFPASEIPSFYIHQSEGNSVTFNVPPLPGCKILGFIVCVVYAEEEDFYDISNPVNLYGDICPEITISNETKMFEWIYDRPKVFFLNEKAKEDMMWLSYWSFENAKVYSDGAFRSWSVSRFENEMEEGDEVKVEIDMMDKTGEITCCLVKKCGVNLLYKQNDQVGSQTNEPTNHP